jgi:hypothetical protein
MATQRLTIATLAGQAAEQIVGAFRLWRGGVLPDVVDRFCDRLRENAFDLPVIYFCEWLDRWLMGDLIPGPNPLQGNLYQAACLSPAEALALADQSGHQFSEQEWLARRLREATSRNVANEPVVIVVLRFVLGPSVSDEEVWRSLNQIPPWLAFAVSE